MIRMKKAAKQKYRLRNRNRNGNASEGLIALALALALSLGPFDMHLFQGARHYNSLHKHNQGVLAVVATTVSAREPFSSPSQLPIASVYDDVLPRANVEWLHKVCYRWNEDVKKHETKTTSTSNPNPKDLIFEFPLEHPENHTPIQRFLNEVIWQMVLREEYDVAHKSETENETEFEATTNTQRPTPRYYVEYWTRQEWHHILAHQDMDEGWERMLRKQRQDCNERNKEVSLEANAHKHDFVDCGDTARRGKDFKHPITGQVLYLKVGSMVKGPTVIFDAANGGDLVAKTPKGESNGNGSASTTTTTTAMVSVPAVEGRLLRFKGDKLHAVPRPHDVYWTFDQSKNHIHTKDYERSVLLFNLWDHSTVLVDKILDCGDGKFRTNRTTCYEHENGGRFAGPPRAASDPTCNPQREWKHIPLVHRERAPIPQQEQKQHEASLFSLLWEWFFGGNSLQREPFQVPLSGDAYKRGVSGYVAKMQSFSWWDYTEEKWAHPARDNLGEAFVPTSMEIEADERLVVEDHLEL